MSYKDFEEPDYHDPFDYDYEGPNSTNHGFGGHGFDDDAPDDEPYFPDKPLLTLVEIREADPDLWEELNHFVFEFAGNRYRRIRKLKKCPISMETYMQAMEDDIDNGWLKLEEATIQVGSDSLHRICLFEFNAYTGEYELSVDSVKG